MSCKDKIVHHTPRSYPQLSLQLPPSFPHRRSTRCTILHHILGVDTDSYHELLGGGLVVKNIGEDVKKMTRIDEFIAFITTAFSSTGSKMGSWAKVEKHNNLTTYESGGFMIFLYLESIHQKWQYCG